MKLKKPCEHNRYDEHSYSYDLPCDGGEFLADDALVIEKGEGEWPHLVYEEWVIHGLEHYEPTAFLDALARRMAL